MSEKLTALTIAEKWIWHPMPGDDHFPEAGVECEDCKRRDGLSADIAALVEQALAAQKNQYRELESQAVLEASISEAVLRAVRGEPVSDFESSFGPVTEARDLRAHRDLLMEEVRRLSPPYSFSADCAENEAVEHALAEQRQRAYAAVCGTCAGGKTALRDTLGWYHAYDGGARSGCWASALRDALEPKEGRS